MLRRIARLALLPAVILPAALLHAPEGHPPSALAAMRPASSFATALYPWIPARAHSGHPSATMPAAPLRSLALRIPPPPGHRRILQSSSSFGTWLRGLPLRDGNPDVRLYDGTLKPFQTAHYAVLDLDVGDKDLQQCADSIIRLRAEYLRSLGCDEGIAFDFTSGDVAAWSRWRAGERPAVTDGRVTWQALESPDRTYQSFRDYLEVVFSYAGSVSLSREMDRVADPSNVIPGDVFIEGGFPGHAVIVMDVAMNEAGERVFLLAQGFTPAQDMHILRNHGEEISPWYHAKRSGALATPEWHSRYETMHRFPPASCQGESLMLAGVRDSGTIGSGGALPAQSR